MGGTLAADTRVRPARDADHTSLYAGQGFRAALDLPAGEIVELLAGRS